MFLSEMKVKSQGSRNVVAMKKVEKKPPDRLSFVNGVIECSSAKA